MALILTTKDYKRFSLLQETTPVFHFSGAKSANRCLPGDEVTFDEKEGVCTLVKRAKIPILVGVLEMTSKTLYGHTSRNVPIYLFHPYNKKYPPMRVGCSSRDRSQNQVAIVGFSEWPSSENLPRSSLIRILGPTGTAAAEMEALTWLYGNKMATGNEYKNEQTVSPGTRRTLYGYTFNIDPPGCKDIDDVFTICNTNSTNPNIWMISISIADVAHFVQDGSPLDKLAQEKGQTLYQDGRAVIPMLPITLSEDAGTLKPDVNRLALSLTFLYNGDTGTLTEGVFEETVVHTNESFTYDEAAQMTTPVFNVLKNVASILKGAKTSDPHEWVEEMMLLYNKSAAKVLLKLGDGLLREHTAASQEKLTAYEAIHPELRYLAFESAKYCPTAEGKVHHSLGGTPYAHASSPLRRYADIVNQRVIKAWLNELVAPKRRNEETEELASRLNALQKNQKRHDRDCFFMQRMLESNTGSLEAVVLETLDMKIKVYVPQWKRVVSVKKTDMELVQPGTPVTLKYYADIRKPHWDEKIVFNITY